MNKQEKLNSSKLIFGNIISKMGSILFDYANSVFLVSLNSSSSSLMAIYQSSENIISIISNIFGGAISDKHNPKKLLILSDFISGISCLLLSLIAKNNFFIISIFLVNLIFSIVYGWSSPSKKSLTKYLVREENLITLNGSLETVSQVIRVITPAFSLAIVNLVGIRGAFIINGISYLISSVITYSIHPLVSLHNKAKKKEKIFTSILNGWLYLISDSEIFSLVILSSLVNISLAGYNLILPYTDTFFSHQKGSIYASLLIAESVGGILGATVVNRINKTQSIKNINYWLLMTGLSLLVVPILFASSKNIIILSIPIIFFNCFLTIFNITFFTFVQVKVASDYIGRVFSVIFTSSIIFMPAGTFLFSKFSNINSASTFFVIGLGIVVISLLYSFLQLFIINKQ